MADMIKQLHSSLSKRLHIQAFVMFIAAFLYSHVVAASPFGPILGGGGSDPNISVDVDDVAENMITSISELPGMVTGLAYLLGLLFAVIAVFKIKEHVENPAQTKLKVGLGYLFVGAALFSLPLVYQAMQVTIASADPASYDSSVFTFTGFISGILGTISGVDIFGVDIQAPDLNGMMNNFLKGLESVPGLFTGGAYALGLVMGVAGLLKIKDYIENPDQTPLREGVVRLLAGGALFSIPTLAGAMASLITGGGGIGLLGGLTSALEGASWMFSGYAEGGKTCAPDVGGLFSGSTGILDFLTGSNSLGGVMCKFILHTGAATAFLGALAYLFGIVLAIWGVLKLRDHALNPSQVSVWEGYSRFIAGGAFFALPVTVEAVRATVAPLVNTGLTVNPTTSYKENLGTSCDVGSGSGALGLDGVMGCFMSDVLGPMSSLLNFFTFVAGVIFIMIGISRLMKSAQDGARGPGGIGTFMTFVAGGMLISHNEFMRAVTGTLFLNPTTKTYATLQYIAEGDPIHHNVHNVISAVLKFMIIVGLISFIRGIFIVRDVAEGNGQASIMAGITHMVGGALAVNLGPLLNAVQTSLGISAYGITFG